MDQIPDLKITPCLHGLRKLQPRSTVLKPVIPSGTTFTESLLRVNTKSQGEKHLVESSSDETRVPTLTGKKTSIPLKKQSLLKVNTKRQGEKHLVESSSDATRVPTLTGKKTSIPLKKQSLLKVNTKSQGEKHLVESSSDETRVPTLTGSYLRNHEWKDTEQKSYNKPNSSVMKDIPIMRGRNFYCYQEYQEKNTIFNLSCKYCNKHFSSFPKLEDLEDHLQKLHANHYLLCCRFCGKNFCTTGRLYEHVICNHKFSQNKNNQTLLGVQKKRSNQLAMPECITQSKELTMHMKNLKRRILTKKSMLEIQLQNDIKSEIILEKSKLKISNEREVVVMGPPTVPSQLQQLKQAVESKRKRKSKSRAEIEIVEDGSNSQQHTDVNSDINPSKEQNSQVNYEEFNVQMEVDDSSMLQGQYITLNGEKFIIKQEDSVEGLYCLNKLDGNVLNSPLDDKRDESGTISKEPSECYEGKMFIKREIEDNDFSYTSREKPSNNANFDNSQRISHWHGSEMFIKRETEDEDNNFENFTGVEQVKSSNIDDSQRISQRHGSEMFIKREIEDEDNNFEYITGERQVKNSNIVDSQNISQCHGKEIEDANLFFSPTSIEEQVNVNNIDCSHGKVECHENEIIIKQEVEDEDLNTFSHTNVEEQVIVNNNHDSQEMVECCDGNEITIKQEVEDEDYDFSYNTA
ncbi:uncharacterized protein LOC134685588 isoform X2 [Mytilus trossulus]|uniref:uncharacterized protein LOC134685588 isoform X2 n=1 Tax=Mytilus trossulus TaxID=6551 RepID=UPI003005179B